MSDKPAAGKITIREIAREAGVSLATVSLVLQNKGKLRPETRERVRRAIETTGYRRRPGRGAPSGKLVQYALVVDDIANPYFHRLYKGIDDNLPRDECVLTMVSSEDSVARQGILLRNLAEVGVSGLVVVPATGTAPGDLKGLPAGNAVLILAVRNIGGGSFNYVGTNPMLGMTIATEHLTALGHRDIAFVGGYQANFAFGERYAGIAASMVKHGLTLRPERVVSGGSTRAFGRAAALKILKQPDPPTAMIGYNDLVAIGVMDGIIAAGLKPGEDIAVVGYDDIPEAADQPVPLTTISTPADKLGEVIAKALLNMDLDGGAGNTIDITYPPRLVTRRSCGAAIPDVAKDGTAHASRIAPEGTVA